MTEIEARNYTYCQAFYSDPFAVRRFLVMTPARTQAERRAWTYALGRAGAWGEPTKILLYPRNYIKIARQMYADGLHD